MVENKVPQLAYDAGLAALKLQDEHLAKARDRALSMLSAATIATSLAASVAQLKPDAGSGFFTKEILAWGFAALGTIIAGTAVLTLWRAKNWAPRGP